MLRDQLKTASGGDCSLCDEETLVALSCFLSGCYLFDTFSLSTLHSIVHSDGFFKTFEEYTL